MNYETAIKGTALQKEYVNFKLDIPSFEIPKGFATALIGENGAGKTTLLNMLAGIRLDFRGDLIFFDKYTNDEKEKDPAVKNRIGYTGPGKYFLPTWTVGDIEDISQMIFDNFDKNRFRELCHELALFGDHDFDPKKKNTDLSDGTKMKLMLAAVLARDTDLLILDEPASPLDPLMRDVLCSRISDYISSGDGEHTVFFSTHNIADMESITDYAIIMEHGCLVEQGFVEELKEKYVLVKGDATDTEAAKKILYSITANPYGFEGICLAGDLDKLAGMKVTKETPSLYQISVAVMKKNTRMVI
ncbi:MAG: ABC transporter ATP-binding protein [Lachnospiraceae bacterium]|nr:ABC transporter ATP-binding protein [Lachnospiraceae bacterium]